MCPSSSPAGAPAAKRNDARRKHHGDCVTEHRSRAFHRWQRVEQAGCAEDEVAEEPGAITAARDQTAIVEALVIFNAYHKAAP